MTRWRNLTSTAVDRCSVESHAHDLWTWTPDPSTCLLRPARQPAQRHFLCKAGAESTCNVNASRSVPDRRQFALRGRVVADPMTPCPELPYFQVILQGVMGSSSRTGTSRDTPRSPRTAALDDYRFSSKRSGISQKARPPPRIMRMANISHISQPLPDESEFRLLGLERPSSICGT